MKLLIVLLSLAINLFAQSTGSTEKLDLDSIKGTYRVEVEDEHYRFCPTNISFMKVTEPDGKIKVMYTELVLQEIFPNRSWMARWYVGDRKINKKSRVKFEAISLLSIKVNRYVDMNRVIKKKAKKRVIDFIDLLPNKKISIVVFEGLHNIYEETAYPTYECKYFKISNNWQDTSWPNRDYPGANK